MQKTLGLLLQMAGLVVVIVSLTVWFFFDHQQLGLIPSNVETLGTAGQVLNFLLVCIFAVVGVAMFIYGTKFKSHG
ncbi:hypothetical protein ACLBWZ_13205 [Brucellaceae bacterium C25G]